MRSLALSFTTCCLLLAVATGSQARILTVRQDGSGQYTNITSAVAAAVANDSIEVGPGTYDEGQMVEIGISITLYSTDGPTATVLSGGQIHRLLNLHDATIQVTGFSLANGQGLGICEIPCGGAAVVWKGAHAAFTDCIFDNCRSDRGGAFYVSDSNAGRGTSMTATNCHFVNLLSTGNGGVAYIVLGATVTFEGCDFSQITTGTTAAIDVYYSHADIRNCLLKSTLCYGNAGAAVYYRSSGTIENNTFVDNTSLGSPAGTVMLHESPQTIFRRNIVSGETDGYGLYYLGVTSPVHSCNVFWHDAAGAIGNDALEADEIEADPLFCDAAALNYALSDNSPAAPASSLCGQLIGARPVGCHLPLPGAPTILTIADIPNDNGRQVRIRWQRSEYDARGQSTRITGYGVYRRQPAAKTSPMVIGKSRLPGVELDGWDFVAAVSARGDAIYQYVAPTLCDTWKLGDPCWSVFFISAMTADPLLYFDSAPDSGYSMDNLPPMSPMGFAVQYVPGTGNALTWGSPVDADFESFRIYRGSEPGFTPSAGSLAAETPAEGWVDAQHGWGVYYKITSKDHAGNESAPSTPGSITETSGGAVPTRFALYPAVPNPFNPRTRIDYDIPAGGGHVQILVYDAAGRLVRSLLDRSETEGRHFVIWDGTGSDGMPVPSGVYFYGLKAPGFEHTLKMTLLQ